MLEVEHLFAMSYNQDGAACHQAAPQIKFPVTTGQADLASGGSMEN